MKLALFAFLLSLGIRQAQMVADPNADARVAYPAYKTTHPRLAIDHAHGNIHTKDGLFKPFAQLAANDGYDLCPERQLL
jgi:hypothetical protein